VSTPNWRTAARLIKRALVAVNCLLTIAVSVVVIIIAIVLFVALVDNDEQSAPTTTAATVGALPSAIAPTTTVEPTASPTECDAVQPEADLDNRVVRVYFSCGPVGREALRTFVYRVLPNDGAPVMSTMQSLVSGPTESERLDGFRSFFTSATRGAILSVTGGPETVVDLRDLGPLPALSRPDEGNAFVAELTNTLFQFDEILQVEYRIEGRCDVFWAHLKSTECRIIDRRSWSNDGGVLISD
jgi:hypothetical protein